jgi:hypothetical protein
MVDRERVLEGDEVTARVVLEAASPVDRLDVYLRLPTGMEALGGTNPIALRLRAGERRELALELRARRWGAHVLAPPTRERPTRSASCAGRPRADAP